MVPNPGMRPTRRICAEAVLNSLMPHGPFRITVARRDRNISLPMYDIDPAWPNLTYEDNHLRSCAGGLGSLLNVSCVKEWIKATFKRAGKEHRGLATRDMGHILFIQRLMMTRVGFGARTRYVGQRHLSTRVKDKAAKSNSSPVTL